MNPRNSAKKIISSVVLFTVLSIAYLAVPSSSWTPVVVFSLLLLAIYASFPFISAPKSSAREGYASIFVYVGPSLAISALISLWGLLTLFVAIFEYASVAWAMNIAGMSCFVSFWIYFRFALKFAEKSESDGEPRSSPSEWALRIEGCATQVVDRAQKKELIDLANSLRFAASNLNGRPTATSIEISNYVSKLEQEVALGGLDHAPAIEALKSLISKREFETRRLRSQA